MFKKNIDIFIIILNIIFFSYYAIQLLVFTDEFALNNLGFFNHAVAGLSEIIGIIFISFVIAYTTNAIFFSILSILNLFFIFRNFKKI